ncbi:MAG: hypothetical protein ACFFBS_05730 [Promethearchaeota archaeon]
MPGTEKNPNAIQCQRDGRRKDEKYKKRPRAIRIGEMKRCIENTG